MRLNWLDRALVNGPYLVLCTSQLEFEAALTQLKIPFSERRNEWIATPQSDATAHYFQNKGETACIVCIRVTLGRKPIEIASLLVHEAVHVWQRFCQDIGEDSPSSEFEAYSIQSISGRLMQAYADKLK